MVNGAELCIQPWFERTFHPAGLLLSTKETITFKNTNTKPGGKTRNMVPIQAHSLATFDWSSLCSEEAMKEACSAHSQKHTASQFTDPVVGSRLTQVHQSGWTGGSVKSFIDYYINAVRSHEKSSAPRAVKGKELKRGDAN